MHRLYELPGWFYAVGRMFYDGSYIKKTSIVGQIHNGKLLGTCGTEGSLEMMGYDICPL